MEFRDSLEPAPWIVAWVLHRGGPSTELVGVPDRVHCDVMDLHALKNESVGGVSIVSVVMGTRLPGGGRLLSSVIIRFGIVDIY